MHLGASAGQLFRADEVTRWLEGNSSDASRMPARSERTSPGSVLRTFRCELCVGQTIMRRYSHRFVLRRGVLRFGREPLIENRHNYSRESLGDQQPPRRTR